MYLEKKYPVFFECLSKANKYYVEVFDRANKKALSFGGDVCFAREDGTYSYMHFFWTIDSPTCLKLLKSLKTDVLQHLNRAYSRRAVPRKIVGLFHREITHAINRIRPDTY